VSAPRRHLPDAGGPLRLLGGVAALAFGVCAAAPEDAPAGEGLRLFVGPLFWAAEGDDDTYRAVLAGPDGAVVALYRDPPATPPEGAEVVRLPGALAVPGLRDAHVHLAPIGRFAEAVDLTGVTSPAEAAVRVSDFARRHPELTAIVGWGWDQTLFEGQRFPSAAELGLPERLVVLSRVDGHAIWVNARGAAIIAEHLAEWGEHPGERALRDASGRPTGVVVGASPALRARLAAPETAADRRRWTARGLEACAAAGLLEVHDMAVDLAGLDALERLARGPEGLPIRVVVYLALGPETLAWARERGPGPVALAPDLSVAGFKIYADGALGSRGAALEEDYSDEPGHRGQPIDPGELAEGVRSVHALGYQIAVHAIGDRALAIALDAIAGAGEGVERRRHRIEHLQVVAPKDWPRLAPLGIVASMQPTHATSDMRWAEDRLGEDRLRGAYAWRTVRDHGVPLAFGSDAPVESLRPEHTLHAAATRQDAEGQPPGGWRPEQRLAVPEAIRAMSHGVAYAAGAEASRGRLAVGQALDLTVFAEDPRGDAAAWREARAVATVRDGRVRELTAPERDGRARGR